jgi:galactokinase
MVIRGGEIKTNKLSNLLDKFEPSPNLKDEFEKFKSNLENSELVVAFPGAFFFIGEHAVMFGHPALYMTIPLYVLIGIKESTKEGINIEVWQRNPETNFFEVETRYAYKAHSQSYSCIYLNFFCNVPGRWLCIRF